MIVEATCKFCQVPLRLQVDGEYAALGDPYKLLKLASCNRCADYRVSMRKVVDQIKRVAMERLVASHDEETTKRARETLTVLLKKMMRLMSDYRRTNMPDWDEGIVDSILNDPSQFGRVLGRLPLLFRESQKELV